MFPLGWSHYLGGGLLIGLGTVLLYAFTGRVGGMSTVCSSTWSWVVRTPFFRQPALRGSRGWRLVYAAGLILGAALWWLGSGEPGRLEVSMSSGQLFLGGLIAGFGARLSRGCTSGHGICGMASLHRSSLFAVLTFLGTGILTATVLAALGGR